MRSLACAFAGAVVAAVPVMAVEGAAFPPVVELSSLDGSNGFVLYGINRGDQSGIAVSCAGDVNGDGFADVLIGSEGDAHHILKRSGESYVVFGRASGFPATINLFSLRPAAGGDGSQGFIVEGITGNDGAGAALDSAGDVNGDGVDDLLIAAPGADPNLQDRAGETYVAFGRSAFPPVFELRSLTPGAGGDGSEGFILKGIDIFDWSGSDVGIAGDINGDGVDDLLIGARRADPIGRANAGETYVVFGRTTGFPAAFELRSLTAAAGGDGTEGFVIAGVEDFDYSATAVSGTGDFNGDGFADLMIGAPVANVDDLYRPGQAYVVFGHRGRFPPLFRLKSLDPSAGGDGSQGFVINGFLESSSTGSAVGGPGDVNADGFDDVLIGAPYASPDDLFYAGTAYAVFGHAAPFAPIFELADLAAGNGAAGFVMDGWDITGYAGFRVSGAGDLNHDGIDDLLVSAYLAECCGEVYVVYGTVDGFQPTLPLATLATGDGSEGFVVRGTEPGDAGASISGGGDINGDGIDDLVIGATYVDANGQYDVGATYVLFGRADERR